MRSWVDRLRQCLSADDALLWTLGDGVATAPLRAGRSAGAGSGPAFPVEGRGTAIERLRRNGLVSCDRGEVSGVEDFVPAGVRSFVAAGANRDGALASVLVVGWTTARPSCPPASFGPLRIAAALLDRAMSRSSPSDSVPLERDLADAVSDSITIVDGDGRPQPFHAGRDDDGTGRESRPRDTGLERCRRAAANGSLDASLALRGIEAVGSGAGPSFQTVVRLADAGRERVTVITASRLPGRRGAVVVHTDLAPATVAKLSRDSADRRFTRLVAAVPLAFSIVAPDGRMTSASGPWVDLAGADASDSSGSRQWWDRIHPDDRQRAVVAADTLVARHEAARVELRLRDSDGSYRWSSCSAAPIFAADGSIDGYVGVAVDISAQRYAEAALGALGARLVAAQEAERSRIARELHDDLGQQIVLLDAGLGSGIRDSSSRAQLEAMLLATRARLQEIASTIHALAHSLHPAKIRLLGLVPTLQALCRETTADATPHVHFETTGVPAGLDENVALCIFRVAQEALHNVVKHSAARAVTVRLAATAATLRLTIVDDGKGFDPLVSAPAGLGLLTMRERVELIGGTLMVATEHARGTTIDVTVPIAAPAAV